MHVPPPHTFHRRAGRQDKEQQAWQQRGAGWLGEAPSSSDIVGGAWPAAIPAAASASHPVRRPRAATAAAAELRAQAQEAGESPVNLQRQQPCSRYVRATPPLSPFPITHHHLPNPPTHLTPQGVLDRLRGARELTLKRLYKLALRKALGNFLAGQLGVDVSRWVWLTCVLFLGCVYG